jgi:ADP-heptose:LPS heptosyltransferase
MREAAAIVQRSVMYIGADTGTRHVAIALGVPTVGVFGRQFPERWSPPDAAEDLAVAHDPGCKATCRHRSCPHFDCIRQIPVKAVVEAVGFLASRHMPHPNAASRDFGAIANHSA